MTNFINLLGKRFGRLLVVGRETRDKYGRLLWDCVCDCGNTCSISGSTLMSGDSKSCGCLHVELLIRNSIKHCGKINGKASREYQSWQDAKARCFNPKNKSFKNYGERGITVCKEWKNSFERFLNDMGKCPTGYTLERKDNDGNYTPDNCIWSSRKNQNRNKRTNRKITINGVCRNICEWNEIQGFPKGLISKRLYLGMSEEKAVLNPLRVTKRK